MFHIPQLSQSSSTLVTITPSEASVNSLELCVVSYCVSVIRDRARASKGSYVVFQCGTVLGRQLVVCLSPFTVDGQ